MSYKQCYEEICEELGWSIISEEDGYIELETYSPAGEDFVISINKNNFINELKQYYTNFDIDEHVEMWIEAKRNGVSGVPSVKVLVEDAIEIDHMLEELIINLCHCNDYKRKD